jgi:hypothetical protein
MLIELNGFNNRSIRFYDSYVCLNYGLTHIESERIHRDVRLHSGDVVNFFVDSRHVYRVNCKKKFMLLLIATGIEYKEL